MKKTILSVIIITSALLITGCCGFGDGCCGGCGTTVYTTTCCGNGW